VIVRVMAAGVNFNNVWAALGKPISVFRYHQEDHHIGGSDASGIVWKVGEGVTRWKPGDEVVVHCNQASYEDPEVHGLDPLAAPSQQIWGYETTWGSFAQFCKVQAQQLLPKPKRCLGGGRLLRPDVLHRLPHARRPGAPAGGPPRADLGRRRRPRRVRHPALQALRRDSLGVVSSAEKGELVKQLGAVDYIDRNEFAGMMRRGDEDYDRRRRASRSRALRPGGRGEARRRARHRLRARRPRHVPRRRARRQAVRARS
jgi:crotonyl-CoA carboxylase/reductase